MPIPINCCCGKKFMVEENLAGQPVQCPCGNVFTVPQPSKIPWKEYYSLGIKNLGDQLKRFFSPLAMLGQEFLCYWGYLIAKEGEEVGIQQFEPIVPAYEELLAFQQRISQEKNAKHVKKLALDIHRSSQKIGEYCWNNAYRFKKFSEIAPVETQLHGIKKSVEHKKSMDEMLKEASRKLPFILNRSVVFTFVGAILAVLLCTIASTLIFKAQGPYQHYYLWGSCTMASLVAIGLPLYAKSKLRKERKRIKKLWTENFSKLPDGYIPPEVVHRWIGKIFESKRSSLWKVSPDREITVPEDISSLFIPDISFPNDSTAQFGADSSEKNEEWCERLYEFCKESFSGDGCINFCFFYTENLPLLDRFLSKMLAAFSEMNETKGEETVWIIRQSINTPQRLGSILSSLEPFFKVEKYSNDRHWEVACRFFRCIFLLSKIYDASGTPAENEERIQLPAFMKIFKGLRECLYALAERRPLLMILERIDHSDPLTLRFLCSLVQGERNRRICFLVSYDRENVAKMPILKETIMFLQKQNCWRTQEQEIEMQNLPAILLGKKKEWEALEYYLGHCSNTPAVHLVGIQGESGHGKTFLGKRFLEMCAKNYQIGGVYHSYREERWEDPYILAPVKKVLEHFKEERSFLDQSTCDRISAILQMITHYKSSKPGFSWSNPAQDTLAKRIGQLEKTTLSDFEIVVTQQNNLWQEIEEVLCIIASHKPFVIFIDDMELADQSMLKFLARLGANAPAFPILVMFSWDQSSVSMAHIPFNEFMTQLRAMSNFGEIPLQTVEPQDVAQYISESFKPNLLAETPDSPFVKTLLEISKGNSLLLTDFLKFLVHKKWLHPFGGFWVLKEEIVKKNLSVGLLYDYFLESLEDSDKRIMLSIMKEAALYGKKFPESFLEKRAQELSLPWEKIQDIFSLLSPFGMLLVQSTEQGHWEFTHEEYNQRILNSISGMQRKEMYRKVEEYLLAQPKISNTRVLFCAEESGDWETVIKYAQIVGTHSLDLFELSTSSEIFDKGTAAARAIKSFGYLARYCLLKSKTFPSKHNMPSLEYLNALLEGKQWNKAIEVTGKINRKEKACELFLKAIGGLGVKEKEVSTLLIEHLLSIVSNIESEYLSIHFLERTIPFFGNADPLKLRSLVEQTLPIVSRIYHIGERTRLYLALQRQLGEMDLDLIRMISEMISPHASGLEKNLSIYYISASLTNNPNFLESLLEEASEISDRVYQIMAIRGVADYLSRSNPDKAYEVCKRIPPALKDISSHHRRMEALLSFLLGSIGEIKQKPFEEILSRISQEASLELIHEMMDVIKQTPDVPGKLECLGKLGTILTRLVRGETLAEIMEGLIEEIKNLQNKIERSKGFIEIAMGILNENTSLAYRYLEEGIQALEEVESPEMVHETVSSLLYKIFLLLDKFPQTLAYPIWDRIIGISMLLEKEERDNLFSELTPALFSVDLEKAMGLALKIETSACRYKVIHSLLALPSSKVNLDTIEKNMMEQASDVYGGILLQELAQKDIGRARRLLRVLPDSLDTQIANAQLCRPAGQRVQEVLGLTKGMIDHPENMSKIFAAIENLLIRKEYDRDGNWTLLELIPDECPEKISLLMRLVLATQEVDTKLACDSFLRIPLLMEKYLCQEGEHSPILKKSLVTLDELMQQLQPSFVETYIDKLLPSIDVISSMPMRVVFIKCLCRKLKEISPDTFLEVVEKLPSELKFKTLEGLVEEYDESDRSGIQSLDDGEQTRSRIECLAALGMLEPKLPLLGQPVRHMLKEIIISIHSSQERMEGWIDALESSAGWDEEFSAFVLDKIFEASSKIPRQDMAPYYKLIRVIYGLPSPLRSDFLMKVIDHLTISVDNDPIVRLDDRKSQFYNAARVLIAILPFGPSYAHSFVEKLLAVPRGEFDFSKWIKCVGEFLVLTRGLVPEKESEWIAQSIGYLDTFTQEVIQTESQEDIFLLRALSMVSLAKDLVYYQEEQALRSAQRVIQLTEYSSKRHRLHRYIILQLSAILDYMQSEIKQKSQEALLPIKIMRLQCAYYHLQALKDIGPKEKAQFLQDEKNAIKEIFNYIIAHLKGTLPHQEVSELEEALVMAHDQLKEEMENAFQKLLVAKSGPGLTQAFFVLAQALCLIDNDTLQTWPSPWLHRMIRIASRIDPLTLNVSGDDLLKADEREEFALLVQRVSLIYPRTVLLLVHSLFSMENISEIPFEMEEGVIAPETIKSFTPPLTSVSLQKYRDRLISGLCLEWVEYNWKEGFLLASSIADQELQANSIAKLVRKSFDYYAEDAGAICNKAYLMLQKMKNSRYKVSSLIEVAIRIAETDVGKVLDIASAIDPMEKKVELFNRTISAFDLDKGIQFIKQIPLPKFKSLCIKALLCKLPSETESRVSYIRQIWEIVQGIREDALRVEIVKCIVRIGIRKQDISNEGDKIVNLMLEMWDNCSRIPLKQSLEVIATTFPVFVKILDESGITLLFENIYNPEYFPFKVSQANFKTVVL